MWKTTGLVSILWCILLILVSGCSDDDPTSPDDQSDQPFIHETSATIGAEGGQLATEDFLLSVPAGALNGNHQLKLYGSDTEQPFGDFGITRTYRIDGLPAEFAAPLRLAVRHQGSYSSLDVLAWGVLGVFVDNLDSTTVFDYQTATDSLGFLVAEFPGGMTGALPVTPVGGCLVDPSESPVTIEGLSGHDIYDPEDQYFRIRYPVLDYPFMGTVDRILHEALATCTSDLGLRFQDGGCVVLPITVSVVPIDSDFFVRTCANPSFSKVWLRVNSNKLQIPEEEMHSHSMAALVVMAYVAAAPYEIIERPRFLWWIIAVTKWAKTAFITDPDLYSPPSEFKGEEHAPFSGLRAGVGENRSQMLSHAAGMIGLVEHLVNQTSFGRGGIGLIVDGIKAGMEPMEALLESGPGPIQTWLPEFFRQYVGGNIYSVPADTFMTLANSGTTSWTISGPTDTLKTFVTGSVIQYPDYSAKMFSIRLNYAQISDEAEIEFEVSSDEVSEDDLTVIVFAYNGQSLDYLGHATALRIGDIPYLMNEGDTHLVATVVNSHGTAPYTGSSQIFLTVEVLDPDPINEVYVFVKMLCSNRVEYVDNPGSNHDYDDRNTIGAFQYPGTLIDNSFTASWYEEVDDQGRVVEGWILAVFDETRDHIERLEVWYKQTWPAYNNYVAEEYCWAAEIPRHLDYYEVSGPESYSYIVEIEDEVTDDSSHRWILFPIGDDQSRITVKFF